MRELFLYLDQKSEVFEVKVGFESRNFPYFVQKVVETRPISSKISRFSVFLQENCEPFDQNSGYWPSSATHVNIFDSLGLKFEFH